MAANETFPYLNSTSQPDRWSTCPTEDILSWQQHYLTPTSFSLLVVAIVLETPMCVVTTSLNVLVILAVWRKLYLRKQKACVLLACLAATDLLVGAVVLPLVITGHIMRLVGARPLCVVDKITTEIFYIPCGASLLHLAIISGERYVAIKHALRYETLVTTRRLTAAVAAAWAIFPVFNVFSIVILKVSGEAALRDMVLNVVVTLWICVVLFSLAYCQVAVFIESRRHRKHIRTHQVSGAAAREILKKDKAARTTAMIVGAVCLCYAPQLIVMMAVTTGLSQLPKRTVVASLYTADLFLYCNSLINPIIYCVRTRDFRRAFGELLNLETSQVNPEFVIPGNGRLQREEGTVWPTSSQNKPLIARSVIRAACHSRSRSLDLSSDPTHVKIRRTNSI